MRIQAGWNFRKGQGITDADRNVLMANVQTGAPSARANGQHDAENRVDVLAAIRVDGGQSFVEARARCRGCLQEAACRTWWLESTEALLSPPDFCPNAAFFRAFRPVELHTPAAGPGSGLWPLC